MEANETKIFDNTSFRLTIRNVNNQQDGNVTIDGTRFRLTIRNVNYSTLEQRWL